MKQLDLFSIKEEKKDIEIKAEDIIDFTEVIISPKKQLFPEQKPVLKNLLQERLPKKDKVQKRGRKSYDEMDAEVDLIEVPEDEILFQKQYYSISEVAKWFKVNTSLLRFWENEFSILKPRKNAKGDRLFRPEDVKNIQLIYHLLRQRKFSMHGAKKYLEANKQHAETNKVLIQSLTKLKSFLTELKTNLGE